jgi:hypothetical protein
MEHGNASFVIEFRLNEVIATSEHQLVIRFLTSGLY